MTRAHARERTMPAELVLLDGPALRDPVTGLVLAEYNPDTGVWHTAAGDPTDALVAPGVRVSARVDHEAARAARSDRLAAWVDAHMPVVRRLCAEKQRWSADDVWEVLTAPPEEPRALAALLARARSEGLAEPIQGEYVASRRTAQNHGRRVQVWRSMAQQRLI